LYAPFVARFLRAASIFLRRVNIFVRTAPAMFVRVVRSRDKFAHSATPADARTTPFAANVANRRFQNRRKSEQRAPHDAH